MAHKRSVRKEVNRIEHKKARAAERQALDGGHHRHVAGMGWGTAIPQPPLLDEESRRYPSRKKGCKRNRKGGGKHKPILRTASQRAKHTMEIAGRRWFWGSSYVCEYCGKAMWGVRPETQYPEGMAHDPMHWTYEHIMERLNGGQGACTCKGCNPS